MLLPRSCLINKMTPVPEDETVAWGVEVAWEGMPHYGLLPCACVPTEYSVWRTRVASLPIWRMLSTCAYGGKSGHAPPVAGGAYNMRAPAARLADMADAANLLPGGGEHARMTLNAPPYCMRIFIGAALFMPTPT